MLVPCWKWPTVSRIRSAFASDFTGYFAATRPDRGSFMDDNVLFSTVLPICTITFLQFPMLPASRAPNKEIYRSGTVFHKNLIRWPHTGDIRHEALRSNGQQKLVPNRLMGRSFQGPQQLARTLEFHLASGCGKSHVAADGQQLCTQLSITAALGGRPRGQPDGH